MDKDEKELHLGHRRRIKERYVSKGFEAMDDKDLLELILTYAIPRRDVYDIARRLAFGFGSVENVLRASPDELRTKGKLSDHTVMLIKLLNDMRTKPFRFIEYRHEQLSSVLKAAEYCHRILRDFPEEAVILLFLDDESFVTDMSKVSCGSYDSAELPIGRIIDVAINQKARRVLIAHNHPSGSSAPSIADVNATDSLEKALASHGISLAEHIIVSRLECTALIHHQTIPMPGEKTFAPWKAE